MKRTGMAALAAMVIMTNFASTGGMAMAANQTETPKKIVQTAGRDRLGEFAPAFAHYNDDVLFGENWNNQDIDVKTRCIITVVSLISSGSVDSSLKSHMENARRNGVTKEEMAAVITHTAFYAGWPKAWAAFTLAKDVYAGK